jgi:hypothetical protein
VRRLGHELVGLDQGELAQAAEVGLVSPDPLLRVEHRVVVALRLLQLDRQAVRDHPVARLPETHPRPGPQYDAGQIGSQNVVRQVVPGREATGPGVPLEELEGRHRGEQRAPHGVVVDRAGHHGDQGLARPGLGGRHLPDVQRLARLPVGHRHPGEHLLLLLEEHGRPIASRHG